MTKRPRMFTGLRPFILCALLSLLVPLSPARFGDPASEDTARSEVNPINRDSIRTDLSDYLWPTDAGRIMTSTFGEYRRTHFHAGIDVSTGNRTGYKVFASRDGYVSRIRVSPNGYGKMLYVRHPDGYFTTYAHLERFSVEIDALVAQEQLRLERYPVDIDCEPHQFPVRKGDIIAYTGETGVGSPHLHFEIRDEFLEPVNPLLGAQINAADNIPPTIRKVAIRPLGERSTVDGGWSARVFTARHTGSGRYRIQETVRVSGDVGFAIDVRDRSIGSRFLHGVYKHELFIDEELIQTVKIDRVPGQHAHQIGLYYDWQLLDAGRGRFERLYVPSPHDLPFFHPRHDASGIVRTATFAEGPHTFRIVCTDFNANTSEVTGKLIFNHPPAFTVEATGTELVVTLADPAAGQKLLLAGRRNFVHEWTARSLPSDRFAEDQALRIPIGTIRDDVIRLIAVNAQGSHSRPSYHFLHKPDAAPGRVRVSHSVESGFVRVMIRADHPFTEVPDMLVYEGDAKRAVPVHAVDIDHYVGSFRPDETVAGTRRFVVRAEVNGKSVSGHDEVDLFPIVAGASGSLVLDDGRLTVSYNPASVFSTLLLRIEKSDDPDEIAYTFLPDRIVLKGGFDVAVRIDPTRENQGLLFRGNGRSELLASTANGNTGVLRGTITRTLGDLAVITDRTAPYVTRLNISRTTGGRPSISFRYGDNLSGVEYDELKMYIDDVLVIPEIDGEHRRVSYTVANPLKRGAHRLVIRMTDKMGNTGTVERTFTVR